MGTSNGNNTKANSANSQKSQEDDATKPDELDKSLKGSRRSLFIQSAIFLILVAVICTIPSLLQPESSHSKDAENRVFEAASEASTIQEQPIETYQNNVERVIPTVSIGILVRNKAHSLPYFLNYLEKLEYPKDKLEILFYADNSIDESVRILTEWTEKFSDKFHYVRMQYDLEIRENVTDTYWSNEHFIHFLKLKQKMLDDARKSWADYHFSVDADVMLTNNMVLWNIVEASEYPPTNTDGLTIIAPLLNCTNSRSYANFWGDMTETGGYKRSEDYFQIKKRYNQGIFPVAVVHSAYIINLKHQRSAGLQFYPYDKEEIPHPDDLVILARSAQKNEVTLYLDNREIYGFFSMPVEDSYIDRMPGDSFVDKWLARDKELFTHLKLQVMINTENTMRIEPSSSLIQEVEAAVPQPSLLGYDKIYVVNLKRRDDRMDRMKYCLRELGISYEYFEAVDGTKLTKEDLVKLNITQLPGYADPYHKRALKYGEIGCFLSHYQIWKDMVKNNYEKILIFEDDIRFEPGFVRAHEEMTQEANENVPDWELLYIGRKRMSKTEKRVPNTRTLSYPDYTYWTLGYALRLSGAHKLLNQRPLEKLVAVDEYIPIMFDRHPTESWLKSFGPRNLNAISAEPLLVEPTHYTGEPNYFSDTELSDVI